MAQQNYIDSYNPCIMSMANIEIQDIQKYNLATVVSKDSKTGITSNKRLLVIKRGFLYYYSNIPKGFKGDSKILETLHELPKCSIEIVNIIAIKSLQNTSPEFSIQFSSKHMMERQDIRMTMTNQEYNFSPKNTSDTITWQFTCDNQFIKQRWVQSLQQLRQYYNKEKQSINNYFSQAGKNQNKDPDRSTKIIPWRQSIKKSDSSQSISSRASITANLTGNMRMSLDQPKLKEETRSQKGSLRRSPQHSKQNEFNIILEPSKTDENVPNAESKIKTIIEEDENSIETPTVVTLKESFTLQAPTKPDEKKQDKKQNTNQDKKIPPLALSQSIQINQVYDSDLEPSFTEEEATNQMHKISTIYPSEMKCQINSAVTLLPENFYTLQSLIFRGCYSFQERIKFQQKLLIYLCNFKEKAIKELKQYVNCEYLIRQKNYKYITKCKTLSQIAIGGLRLRIAQINSERVVVNNKEKTFFNEDQIKILKTEFKIYSIMFSHLILKQLKSNKDFRLRVPLAIFAEYRGLTALIHQQDQLQGFTQLNEVKTEFKEEVSTLLDHGFELKTFEFKKRRYTQNGAERWHLILFVKTHFNRSQQSSSQFETVKQILGHCKKCFHLFKHHNVSFVSPLDSSVIQRARTDCASLSQQALSMYIKTLRGILELNGPYTKEEVLKTLCAIKFAKSLRKIYRAAQGEVSETYLFNLVLRRDKQILPLMQQADCSLLSPIDGQLFSMLQFYLGVAFRVNQEAMKRGQGDILISTSCRAVCQEYKAVNMELSELAANFSKHLLNNQMNCQKLLGYIEPIIREDSNEHLDYLLKVTEMRISQNNYEVSIKELKHCLRITQAIATTNSSANIPIYLLMLKAYAQYDLNQMAQILKQMLDNLKFNFGQSCTELLNVYSIAAHYYSKYPLSFTLKQRQNNYEKAQQLLIQAKKLAINLFGAKSQQYIDILMDLSRFYSSSNRAVCLTHLRQAKSIAIKQKCNADTLFSIQLYQAILDVGTNDYSSAEEKISLLERMLSQQSNISKDLKFEFYKLLFEFGEFLQKREYMQQGLDNMWTLTEKQSKLHVLDAATKVLRKRNSRVSFTLRRESMNLTTSQIILRFQECREGYQSVLQMVEDIMGDQEHELHQSLIDITTR